jgi:hypothetical protein
MRFSVGCAFYVLIAVSLIFSPDDPIVKVMLRYPDDLYEVGLVALFSLYPHDGF